MAHNTGQNYSTKSALVQTYLVNSHKSLDKNGRKAPTFFYFFVEKCSKLLHHLYLGTGLVRAGSCVTAQSSSTSLPRSWRGHTELRSSSAGAVPLCPLPGRASHGEAVCIRSSSLLHLIGDAK